MMPQISEPEINTRSRFNRMFACVFSALLFGGNVRVNPAHPKQIGGIDPSCHVTDVLKGNGFLSFPFYM